MAYISLACDCALVWKIYVVVHAAWCIRGAPSVRFRVVLVLAETPPVDDHRKRQVRLFSRYFLQDVNRGCDIGRRQMMLGRFDLGQES